jgi:hypothetical protein
VGGLVNLKFEFKMGLEEIVYSSVEIRNFLKLFSEH